MRWKRKQRNTGAPDQALLKHQLLLKLFCKHLLVFLILKMVWRAAPSRAEAFSSDSMGILFRISEGRRKVAFSKLMFLHARKKMLLFSAGNGNAYDRKGEGGRWKEKSDES